MFLVDVGTHFCRPYTQEWNYRVFSISRNCQTSFQDVDQFTAPAAMQKSMLSPDIWWCQTFLFQPFWWKEIVFHCCLILVSLITKDVEHL